MQSFSVWLDHMWVSRLVSVFTSSSHAQAHVGIYGIFYGILLVRLMCPFHSFWLQVNRSYHIASTLFSIVFFFYVSFFFDKKTTNRSASEILVVRVSLSHEIQSSNPFFLLLFDSCTTTYMCSNRVNAWNVERRRMSTKPNMAKNLYEKLQFM